MKSLLLTLALMVMVSFGVSKTFAAFRDTESSTGSSFQAGTVDISVDTNNPWTQSQQVTADGNTTLLKPSQVGFTKNTVTNVGNNSVHVWNRIFDIVDSGGNETYPCNGLSNGSNVTSEPECAAEVAIGIRKDNVSGFIDYDLKMNSQTIVDVSAGKSFSSRNKVWTYLGQLLPGANMEVEHSYHLRTNAGNEYQGDRASFSLEY